MYFADRSSREDGTSNFLLEEREALEIRIRANRKSRMEHMPGKGIILHCEQDEDMVHLHRTAWITLHCGVPLRNETPIYPPL